MRKNVRRREFLVSAPLALAGAAAAGSALGSAPHAEDEHKGAVVREAPRDTPIVHESDVCVVGGSCTGVFAAVAAARLGAKVSLIELNGFFGGVATASLVNVWHSLKDSSRKEQIIGGLTEEVIDRLRLRDAVAEHGANHFELNPEVLKLELDRLVAEAGIRPFLHAMFVAPAVEDGRMTTAIIEDKSGRSDPRPVHRRHGMPTDPAVGLSLKRDNVQPPTYVCILQNLNALAAVHKGFNINKVIFEPKQEAIGGLSGRLLFGTGKPPDALRNACSGPIRDADQLTRRVWKGGKCNRSVTFSASISSEVTACRLPGCRQRSAFARRARPLPAYADRRGASHQAAVQRYDWQQDLPDHDVHQAGGGHPLGPPAKGRAVLPNPFFVPCPARRQECADCRKEHRCGRGGVWCGAGDGQLQPDGPGRGRRCLAGPRFRRDGRLPRCQETASYLERPRRGDGWRVTRKRPPLRKRGHPWTISQPGRRPGNSPGR